MKISQIIEQTRTEGQVYPPWYYGYTYTDYMRDVKVYHLLPLNFIVRSFLIMRRSYQHTRLLPWDMEMIHLKCKARATGYDTGFKDGLRIGRASVIDGSDSIYRSQKILDGKQEEKEEEKKAE